MTKTPAASPRVFSGNSAPESERLPAGGEAPRSSDTLVGVTGAPDPDYHPEAMAHAVADSEAGASGEDDDGGGITPLAVMKDRAEKARKEES